MRRIAHGLAAYCPPSAVAEARQAAADLLRQIGAAADDDERRRLINRALTAPPRTIPPPPAPIDAAAHDAPAPFATTGPSTPTRGDERSTRPLPPPQPAARRYNGAAPIDWAARAEW